MAAAVWPASDMMTITWFHNVDRHQADCLLQASGQDGCYLLRPSKADPTKPFALSVTFQESIRHMNLEWRDGGLVLAQKIFPTAAEFSQHVERSRPMLSFESGVTVLLEQPLPREAHDTTCGYQKHVFTRQSSQRPPLPSDIPVIDSLTREGQLLKKGKINTSWKYRWFKLRKDTLDYFKDRDSSQPQGSIPVSKMRKAELCDTEKLFGFNLVTPDRTYFLSAETKADRDEWMECLQFKINLRDPSRIGGQAQSTQATRQSVSGASTAPTLPTTHEDKSSPASLSSGEGDAS